MAFISQDWRDPGNIYLKSDLGHWELTKVCRKRIFETLSENFIKRAFRQSVSEFECGENKSGHYLHEIFHNSNLSGFYQPHIIIKQISTKESAVITSLSEALLALDFKVAIRDIRRFGYVCRVLQIFIIEKLAYLSGRTQLYIIELLKEISREVLVTQNNTNLIRNLFNDFESTLEKNKYNHVGSSQLWKNHLTALEEMKQSLNTLEFIKHDTPEKLTLENLPQECLIKILNNITSPQDLQMTGQASLALQNLVDDALLWKKLVEFHYTHKQLQSVLLKDQNLKNNNFNWKFVYTKLLYKFGDGHYFPIKLGRCLKCSSIFWPIFGHPCISNNNEENYKSLSPEDFVNLFHL